MSLERIIEWDQQASLWLNSLHSPITDPFWGFMSDVRIWFPAYVLIMLFFVWHMGWKKGIACVVGVLLTVALCDQLSAHLKDFFERLRPCYNTWMITSGLHLPYGRSGGLFSFFSSHASNVFGFATAGALLMRWYGKPKTAKVFGWCVFIWAALVGYSRIMMGAHFLGDVLVGTAFGILMGTGMAWLTRAVITKAKL